MTDNPTRDRPDESTASEKTDANSVEMDETESAAGFLDDLDPANYPSVLRLTATSQRQHRRETLERVERWEAGEDVPHVVNFQEPSDLRALLTDRRIELLRSVMVEQPASIRQLAERLERDVKTVHDDLQVLAGYDIVHFEQDGRAKRPFVPYETIEVNLEIRTSERPDDAAPA